jgi:hypothetical protein
MHLNLTLKLLAPNLSVNRDATVAAIGSVPRRRGGGVAGSSPKWRSGGQGLFVSG